jgi:hypothetical protein
VIIIYSQTSSQPALGDGSSNNPYQIATLENLYWIGEDVSRLDDYYVQMAIIEASATVSFTGVTPKFS